MTTQRIVPARTLTMHSHYVIKQDLPELMSVEVEKTRKAREIGKACGLFRVPEVLDYDPDTGIAKLELIDRMQSIGSVLSHGKNCDDLIARVGKALATIHNELKLSSDMVIELPSVWEGPEKTNVFIHGDFNVMNVNYDVVNNELVILDWQMTEIWEGRATSGTQYFDIMWFMQTLFHYNLFRPIYSANIFLQGYDLPSNNEALLRSYMQRCIKEFVKNSRNAKPWYRYVLYRLLLLRFGLFINSFRLY